MSTIMRFEKLQDKQCESVINFLLSEKIHFSLFCLIDRVKFMPELPREIMENFQPISLFVLKGYTFDSIELTARGIIFEAGFGSENIGRYVEIGFRDILQVIITNPKDKDVPVFTRLSCKDLFDCTQEDELQKSMEAIMSNPHNKQYL